MNGFLYDGNFGVYIFQALLSKVLKLATLGDITLCLIAHFA